MTVPRFVLVLWAYYYGWIIRTACSEPLSRPYIAYRTDPFDQPIVSAPDGKIGAGGKISPLITTGAPEIKRPLQYDEVHSSTCRMHFSLGLAKGVHVDRDESILAPPVLFPSLDGLGSNVMYTTSYEHVHLLRPGLPISGSGSSSSGGGAGGGGNIWKEVLVEPPRFPLLMESSVFLTSPIVHDSNADGLLDVILVDYDGGLSVIGLQNDYRHHAQVPRLYVRRQWVESVANGTVTKQESSSGSSVHDPFHSYFEYYYVSQHGDQQQLIRGESANVLSQDSRLSSAVSARRRLEETASVVEQENEKIDEEVKREGVDGRDDDIGIPEEEIVYAVAPGDRVEAVDGQSETKDNTNGDVNSDANSGKESENEADEMAGDKYRYDEYPTYDDGYRRYRGDDMYSAQHNEYYDTKHYIRITPHILADPVLAEIPKIYSTTNEKEDILFVPVSYYFDEDEYDGLFRYKRFKAEDLGDETEVRRGYYLSSAIMMYIMGEYGGRWSSQMHLDLSTDPTAPENVTIVGNLTMRSDTTQMSAMCLASPTVADIDGSGDFEVLLGTSMGMVYLLDARTLMKRFNWPVQMPRPVEHQIVVEDVTGNTNLEIFVADIAGNVVCLSPLAEVLWHQNWLATLEIESSQTLQASSPLSIGDVDGDGENDIVQVIRINDRIIIFAVKAATGKLLERFPLEIDGTIAAVEGMEGLHQKLPQPLLVDLHAHQSLVEGYIQRSGKKWTPQMRQAAASGIGGIGPGLHIVVPAGEDLYIVEASTGCTNKVSVGEPISTMVQVDDVHGTNRLDLVVATGSGNVITLETEAPFHPANTWVGGHHRGRSGTHAHGFSASQGIFVHESSRQTGDIFGVYVPVTFEIFDNRPRGSTDSDARKYIVEIRDGPSWKRVLHRAEFTAPGKQTVNVYIKYGPGFYRLSASLHTGNGIIYEDTFTVAYNVGFMDGFGMLLWLPLLIVSTIILFYGNREVLDDTDYGDSESGGLLGRHRGELPT